MRILFTGSRDFTNLEMVVEVMKNLPPDTVVIHGGAKGLDTMVDVIAEEMGLEIERFPIDKKTWDEVGKQAGHLRNSQMLYEGKPELVMAFRSKMMSKGTNDMLLQAARKNIPRKIFDDF